MGDEESEDDDYEGGSPGHESTAAEEEKKEEGDPVANLEKGVMQLKKELKDTQNKMKMPSGDKGQRGEKAEGARPEERPARNLQQLQQHVRDVEDAVGDRIDEVKAQLSDLETSFGLLAEKVNTGQAPADAADSEYGFNALCKKIQRLEEDLETLTNTSAKLVTQAAERQETIASLQESLREMQQSKVDHEEMDETLLDKADLKAVKRKLSREEFEAVVDLLYKALLDAFHKFEIQEKMCHNSISVFNEEMKKKLDKKEIEPFKRFINKKMRSLHERLVRLARLRRAQEAAATKKPLVKDLWCLSCDNDAYIMKLAEAAVPEMDRAPPYRNIKPFLTYELDRIRKDSRTLPSRSQLRYQTRLYRPATPATRKRRRDPPPCKGQQHHVCNRYCGGSHTLTTADQRLVQRARFVPCVMVKQAPCVGGGGGEAQTKAKAQPKADDAGEGRRPSKDVKDLLEHILGDSVKGSSESRPPRTPQSTPPQDRADWADKQ